MNIFKQAILERYRWNLDGKSLSVEQLPQLSVTQLDLIGKELYDQLPKQESGYSRAYSTSTNNRETEKLQTMLAIVQVLADDKDSARMAKDKAKEEASQAMEKLRMLQQLKAQQTQASLSSLTPEQIQAEITQLQTMLKG